MDESDEMTSSRIKTRLDEAGLGRYGLRVRCVEGLVTLQGIVDILADKQAAGRVAREIAGAGRVENAITVCTDGRVTDGDVAMEVAQELAAGPARGIGVEVSGGRVKLVGQVATAGEAALAIRTASKARGVREVQSGLAMTSEALMDDPSLVNLVETALADLLGPPARRIMVSARKGAVTLAGRVADGQTAEKAARVVMSIPGVRKVENRLLPHIEPHDLVIRELQERIGANPFLNGAPLRFTVRDGRLVVEGEVPDLKAKRALEQAIRDVWSERRDILRGLDNRVRVSR